MAIYRAPLNYLFGTLDTAVAVSDTTISSNALTNIGTSYSTGYVLPLVIHDPSIPAYEVVWVTAHTAGAAAVTVLRGKEGTSARAWPAGTQVLCTPTATRDTLGVSNSGALPTDAHVGLRELENDTGLVVERTYSAGWQPSVGVAMPGDIGPDITGAYPAGSATMIVRAGRFVGTTDANGRITVSYRTPLPTGTQSVVVTPYGTWDSPVSIYSTSATGFVVQCWSNANYPAGTALGSGDQLGAMYVAVGC